MTDRKTRYEAETAEARDGSLLIEKVSKTYPLGRRPGVAAIEELSADVQGGEFFSVVGPSGSGKTTLLKIIAGLLQPSRGEVRVGGRLATGPIEDFGIVFQQPILLPWRSALDNVLLPIEMLGWRPEAYRARALDLLQTVGLEEVEHLRPGELSGGMQQRVSLCRSLIHDPAILLMDEPFSSVDEFGREALNDHLLKLWSSAGKTIVFVTHNVSEAVYLSDRVAVLTRGPARLVDIVPIHLPRPRTPSLRFEPDFFETVRSVRERLKP